MDRPKPRIFTNVAAAIMNTWLAAKMAVRQKNDETRAEHEEDQSRAARRHRYRNRWYSRKNWGHKSIPGTQVLRGYFSRLSHVLSGYMAEKQLRIVQLPKYSKQKTKNESRRARIKVAMDYKATCRNETQKSQRRAFDTQRLHTLANRQIAH